MISILVNTLDRTCQRGASQEERVHAALLPDSRSRSVSPEAKVPATLSLLGKAQGQARPPGAFGVLGGGLGGATQLPSQLKHCRGCRGEATAHL